MAMPMTTSSAIRHLERRVEYLEQKFATLEPTPSGRANYLRAERRATLMAIDCLRAAAAKAAAASPSSPSAAPPEEASR